VTSRISAIRKAGKPALVSVGIKPQEAQRAPLTPLLTEKLELPWETNAAVRQPGVISITPRALWQLGIVEVVAHNLEVRGREEVNRLLQEGWHLLHIYTLKYRDDGVWRERPMAILGRSRVPEEKKLRTGVEPPAAPSR